MLNVNQATDYIIERLHSTDVPLNVLKLHKLLYYVQAWHLAFYGKQIMPGVRFQAWVHGPVSREIYDRFSGVKNMYSPISILDRKPEFHSGQVSEGDKNHINSILDLYAPYTGDQLEYFTHQETPWQNARVGLPAHQRSETLIDEGLMQSYYAERLQ